MRKHSATVGGLTDNSAIEPKTEKDDSLQRFFTEQPQYQTQVTPTDVNSQKSFKIKHLKRWNQIVFLYQNYIQNQMLHDAAMFNTPTEGV